MVFVFMSYMMIKQLQGVIFLENCEGIFYVLFVVVGCVVCSQYLFLEGKDNNLWWNLIIYNG